LELQAAQMHIHLAWPFGLHPNHVLPQKLSVDYQCLRRSNRAHLELAVSFVNCDSYRS
jgi:hypothetical protein